ncbi:MAG: Eco57I restriction-modification methylase domain-containing protein [Candidatus Hodarchaeales archaeon]|jgi:adenine-specific DNA-methyltransferase
MHDSQITFIGENDSRERSIKGEISQKFYDWYNALLNGGTYKDIANVVHKITLENCLTHYKNIAYFSDQQKDREHLVRLLIFRLLFIKFLMACNIISPRLMIYLSSLSEKSLNIKLKELFFGIVNTPLEERSVPDSEFQHIPYLNASLFTRNKIEHIYPNYQIKAESYYAIFHLLDSFTFITGEDVHKKNTLNPEILGYIFERAMNKDKRKGTGTYYTPKNITRLIAKDAIQSFILTKTNQLLIKDNQKPIKGFKDVYELDETILKNIWNIIDVICVCDNTCGSGIFLLAVADILFDIKKKISLILNLKYKNIVQRRHIIKNNLYGVDINPIAIEITKLRLLIWLLRSFQEKKFRPFPNMDFNIRVGNSLIGFINISRYYNKKLTLTEYLGKESEIKNQLKKKTKLINQYKEATGKINDDIRDQIVELNKKLRKYLDQEYFNNFIAPNFADAEFNDFQLKLDPFHWPLEFENVFTTKNDGFEGFDIIIGNPPYLGESGNKEMFRILKKCIPEYYERKMDLWYFFLHRSIDLTKKRGFISYITSNYWLTAFGAFKLRQRVMTETSILRYINFQDNKVFSNAKGVHTNIFTIKKEVNESQNIETTIYNKTYSNNTNLLEKLSNQSNFLIDQSKLWFPEWDNFIRFIPSEKAEIIKYLIKNSIKIVDKGFLTKQGIVTGANKVKKSDIDKYNFPENSIGDGVFIFDLTHANDSETIKSFDHKEKELLKPFFKNSDINQYECKLVSDKLVLYLAKGDSDIDTLPNIKQHSNKFASLIASSDFAPYIHRPRERSLFTQPKIINPQRSKTNTFAYIPIEWYAAQDVYYTIRRDKNQEKLKLLLGIYNSSLAKFWFENMGKRKGQNLELFGKPIDRFPLSKNFDFYIKIFPLIDYLQFIVQAQWEEFRNEISLLLDLIIVEMYFQKKIFEEIVLKDNEYTLNKAITKYLQLINFDKWFHFQWLSKLKTITQNQINEFNQVDEVIRTTIKTVMHSIRSDGDILSLKDKMKSLDWIKMIIQD